MNNFTQEKSEALAGQIELIKIYLPDIDLEYLKSLSAAFEQQASKQNSMSVLSPSYDFKRSDLLKEQSTSMKHLAAFIESLKKCDELKRQIKRNQLAASGIENLFV